jgi:hypothetical protein
MDQMDASRPIGLALPRIAFRAGPTGLDDSYKGC